MPIDNVHLGIYPRTFIDSSSHYDLQAILNSIIRRTLTHLNVPLIDIFMLTHSFHTHSAGRPNERVVIFINGTRKTSDINEPTVLDTNTTLFGVESTFTDFLPPSGDGVVIKSDEGIPVAEWFDDTWELNILFDLFDNSTNFDNKVDIFTHIMKAFNVQVWYQKTIANSWKHSTQRDKLRDSLCSRIRTHRENTLAYDKRQIQQWESDILSYQRALKQIYDQLFQKRRQLGAGEDYLSEILSTLENDLNILIQHEKITDVHINNEFITIFTTPLRIYASNGRIYQGGAYTIKINMFTSDISFNSDCQHTSFWSTQDPHPHVDGQTGKACLGNIDSTIAELCSQMQLYALVMILIDFLESANTADAAGKCVVNWPEIDEDGNLIIKDDDDCDDDCDDDDCDDDYRDCDYCGCEYHIDDLYDVYDGICRLGNDVIPVNRIFVCNSCRDDYYHWSNSLNEYISNEVDYDD